MENKDENVMDKIGDAVEDGKELVNEVLEDKYEATHKKHTFSVFDTWYELLAVIFAIIYITFSAYWFIAHEGYEGGMGNIIKFALETVMAVFVVFCFCAIVEVQEKLDIMSDNLDLMAGYMHDYYLDIEDDLTVIGGFDEQTYVQQKTPFADDEPPVEVPEGAPEAAAPAGNGANNANRNKKKKRR